MYLRIHHAFRDEIWLENELENINTGCKEVFLHSAPFSHPALLSLGGRVTLESVMAFNFENCRLSIVY